jgi:hypothetical protein
LVGLGSATGNLPLKIPLRGVDSRNSARTTAYHFRRPPADRGQPTSRRQTSKCSIRNIRNICAAWRAAAAERGWPPPHLAPTPPRPHVPSSWRRLRRQPVPCGEALHLVGLRCAAWHPEQRCLHFCGPFWLCNLETPFGSQRPWGKRTQHELVHVGQHGFLCFFSSAVPG